MGMRKGVSNEQIKALAMAMAGATIAAVVTMFVPVAMLETFTGATGLSELVPAAAAPLGDTARALIAFGTGVLTLAVLAFLLLRHDRSAQQISAETAPAEFDETLEASSFKDRFVKIAMPKMPWSRSDDDITELADLPKLRNGDSHPDAPPRRPLSAQQDLPVFDLTETGVAGTADEHSVPPGSDALKSEEDLPLQADSEPEQITEVAALTAPATPSDIEPTLAEMVAQLEAAVAERQRQLVELEAVAAQLDARQVSAQAIMDSPAIEQSAQPQQPERQPNQRPPLEAVPATVRDDDMDSALAAALATLHRMNGTDR
jgi:hypothetical protein